MKQLAIPASLPRTITALDRALSESGVSSLDGTVPAAVWRRALAGPAAEFLARPGKELRTTIVRAGWTLGGGPPAAMCERLPLVIELLHAGSLIIDDVEDGSEDRRGAPTLHRLIGVPLAINTGSWMYFWALAELAELGLPPAAELIAQRTAVSALVRCHQGQALDLAVRIADLDLADVPAVVAATTRLKTGGLCRLAAE
ncbi:MAG: polyprenyl synthetase family protein, partial [Myxococcota bacterium]|nr:polyprenyl synthetase family protein [Myxococcota bacterium]